MCCLLFECDGGGLLDNFIVIVDDDDNLLDDLECVVCNDEVVSPRIPLTVFGNASYLLIHTRT